MHRGAPTVPRLPVPLQPRHARARRNFFLDFFSLDRTTRTSGWRFEGIVLILDAGVVLFGKHAGEPRRDTTEGVRNPLGPLQNIDPLAHW